MKDKLMRKISNKEIEVGVVGLGYVGLPLAVEKARFKGLSRKGKITGYSWF